MQTRQDLWRTFILVQNVATAEEGWCTVDETKRRVEMSGVLLMGGSHRQCISMNWEWKCVCVCVCVCVCNMAL